MTINDVLTDFHGLPVVDFAAAQPLPVPGPVAWRIGVPTYDAEVSWPEAFAEFLEHTDPSTVTAIVVGGWPDPYDRSSAEVVQTLVDAAPRLPALRALFLGDMTFEDCEISWIVQSDVTSLLTAFPALEEFGVRGGSSLVLSPVRHSALQRLVVEAGGLPAAVTRAVAASDLPALTDLELWLGTDDYGADSTVDDLTPILTGTTLPALKRLALRNSDIETEIAVAVASAPVVAQLTALDLSMGVLKDEAAEALMAGVPLGHLTSVNLRHNYFSDPVRERLREFFADLGVEAVLDRDDADAYEYDGTTYYSVAVAE